MTRLPLKLTEGAFQEMVMDLARARKWRVAHIHDSRRQVKDERGIRWVGDKDVAGFPDLVLVRLSRIIFAELKTDDGKVTEVQAQWLKELELTGKVEVCVWRPKTWDSVIALLR